MPNYDEKTGIHYGVISPNSVSSYAMDDIYQNGNDPHYENMKEEIKDMVSEMIESTAYTISDEAKEKINDIIMDDLAYGYENPDGAMDFSDKEYTLHNSGDNFGLYVIKSPYYTFCRQCSPCAPGAGDLDNSISPEEYDKTPHNTFMYGTVKAYCLDKSFFEGEKAPYRVFRVDDDQEVV